MFVITGPGGIYSDNSPARGMDFQEPYLRAMLGFLGLDVTFIHVEGLKTSPEAGRGAAGASERRMNRSTAFAKPSSL